MPLVIYSLGDEQTVICMKVISRKPGAGRRAPGLKTARTKANN